ncbi:MULTISPECIES: lipopolysaccharide transport periplasmic protein LptA [Helicobacter]|uniref:Lipopolysaccharide transport periplasmic protein LptA n=1 Tax=Helicobacter typhlonius TaxID=76936 RepID=A0A099UFF7_9HELI|nr:MULTISPECIES: lipopolysaccharide transport periplasmic protein LptA [Helicobacter]TLD78861.1 lipopolysaccharide transport periplasmic protein LptA [Helicobacter typhlonius]TLD90194.1 lipopolysaccharide transport periplasmic protein LptA [Helicobacter sp. MIT 03-1616]CUU40865.1 OstA family organic solvent tolerance protein [Helicobacter typhlonius]
MQLCKIYAIVCLVNFFALSLSATETLQVSAKKIKSDLKNGETTLSGDVFITKGEDKLWADSVIIETNKKNQPLKYTAIGSVRFYVKMPNKEISGRAKKATYDVQKDEYKLLDNAVIEEKGKTNIIRGNMIVLSPATEEASIQGTKQKPSVVTFSLDNEK